MTFRQRYLLGQADFEEIFDLTDTWNFSDETCTLREYLGLTPEEEDIWVSDSDEALEDFMEKEKDRCILFTDIDGTLVNDQKELTQATVTALRDFLKDGNYVVLSTGRARISTLETAQSLGLRQPNCYAICYNGAKVYNLETEECIYNDPIDLDLVKLCFDEAHKFGIHIQTYTEDGVIADRDHPDLHKYAEILKINATLVDDVIETLRDYGQNPPKMLVIDTADIEKLHAFRNHLKGVVGDRLNMFFSNPYYLELVSPTVNKGNAVHFVCEYLGVQNKNSAAAGDAENDISMIQAAGIGVAMINGTDEVKKAASYITKNDNNHDGVIEVLNLFKR